MTTVVPDRKGIRRLRRFERAACEKEFDGTIPWDSEEAIAAHEALYNEYDRAEELMLQHLNDQALRIHDLEEKYAALYRDYEKLLHLPKEQL